MNARYGRDLDLNLLRVLVAVADHGSVTRAASQLYLTQPAVSAALRRLNQAVGAPLFTRQGRGLVLTARGGRLVEQARTHLTPLIDAVLSPAGFDPRKSERVFRIGTADALEGWLLPRLLVDLEHHAPRMRVVSLPVTFRSVGELLGNGRIDMAVTVADDLPAGIRRRPLFTKGFVCLYDPRQLRLKKRLSERDYFAREHVIVSYNGDLRGIIEDFFGKQRRVRCSVSTFSNIGALIDGSSLLATIPSVVAEDILALRPHLATAPVPLPLEGSPIELLWAGATDDDPACSFMRERIAVLLARRAVKARAKHR